MELIDVLNFSQRASAVLAQMYLASPGFRYRAARSQAPEDPTQSSGRWSQMVKDPQSAPALGLHLATAGSYIWKNNSCKD